MFKDDDGDLCGFVCCLNKVAQHLTKEHTKMKTNRVFRKAKCIDINKCEDMEEVGTEGEDVSFLVTLLHISLSHSYFLPSPR